MSDGSLSRLNYLIIFCRRVRAVEVPCVLNIAAVKLRSKEFDDVIYECNKVLDMEVRTKFGPCLYNLLLALFIPLLYQNKTGITEVLQINIKADCPCL